ncbi:MAG: DUF2225 domain-containing protein [Lachnospiraceae bacterium]
MENGIFAGLEAMGLGDLKNEDIFKDNHLEPTQNQETGKEKKPQIREEDMLFDKTYECPVCNSSFKERTLRTGKARLIGTDMDLRAKFEGIEPLKYDVVLCPRCGYTAVSRYFGPLATPQRKKILEKITPNYIKQEEHHEVFSYEEAINRYRLALVNAVVKMAKASEKAYICLRAGWLVRSYLESLNEEEPQNVDKIHETEQLENEFLKNAYDGFTTARGQEGYPMCGMDEVTVDYLIANLSMRFGHYDEAAKILSALLVSPSCNNRMKDKVRDLKEELKTRLLNDK